jgi:ornithine cyclodeaminase/alanine dehydrogenase-like protein (mu-crystallin family)
MAMRYLSANDLVDLVPPATLVRALDRALRDFAAQKVIVPTRQHVDFGGNTLLTMPVIGNGAFGVKIVSIVPSNAARGVPVVNGLMTLSDGVTGSPLAVMDAAMLTAQRTGAVGALGLTYTTPSDVDRIGIIGTGVQGIWQAIFACAVRPIHTIYFFSRSEENAQRFTAAVSKHVSSVRVARCVDVNEVLAQSPVMIAATTSTEPVLPARRELLQNKHFISVGSFKPAMQELPSAVYELAREVVVDSEAARVEAGDLIRPLSSGAIREESIIHIADLAVGKRTIDVTRTTAFKSVGWALYDLYAARAFLDEAHRLGRGQVLSST